MQLQFLVALVAGASVVAAAPVLEERTTGPTQGKCVPVTPINLFNERQALLSAGKPGLIPLIYADFIPSTTVNTYYNGKYVPTAQHLSALTDTVLHPDVYFPKPFDDNDDTYTLIINDPDAPPPLGLPTFLHWIRRGLKPNCNTPATDGGSDVRPYVSPTPPPLVQPTNHRYALTILREPKAGYNPNYLENLAKLTTFDIRTFEKETGAKVIASNYFLGSTP